MNARPLRGFAALSIAVNLPCALVLARLAAMGAQTLKIEPPTGDPLERAAPAWYAELTAGVTVRRMDLKSADDRALLDEDLSGRDLLLTAMRPAALARLNLANLNVDHPHLAHVEIVGHEGSMENLPGHDLTYQAVHGTLSPPRMPLVLVADLLGAERAVCACLGALVSLQRTHTGGRHRVALDTAAKDAGASARHGLTGPDGRLGGALPTYRIYESRDGHVALAALERHFEARVHEQLGGTVEELESAFAAETTEHWERWGRRMDVPIAGVRSPSGECHDHG